MTIYLNKCLKCEVLLQQFEREKTVSVLYKTKEYAIIFHYIYDKFTESFLFVQILEIV